mmetsp:Transcript_11153/g.24866  ORF Transcript_11153/g.24866 Transcript_11153/m.24866 type:complete len:168 (+) Transcript_11153:94-597(+)
MELQDVQQPLLRQHLLRLVGQARAQGGITTETSFSVTIQQDNCRIIDPQQSATVSAANASRWSSSSSSSACCPRSKTWNHGRSEDIKKDSVMSLLLHNSNRESRRRLLSRNSSGQSSIPTHDDDDKFAPAMLSSELSKKDVAPTLRPRHRRRQGPARTPTPRYLANS